jgi:uncharacterized protein (TIGR02391 family)
MPIVERSLDVAWPEWTRHVTTQGFGDWEYAPLRDVARKAIVWLERRAEVDEALGENGPMLAATALHQDIWDAAKSPWRNGHYGDAVRGAARSLNGLVQRKVGRRDASDAKLVGECFSLKEPSAEQPRLRLIADDGSETYASLHEGAAAFGRGCFMAIRNVLNHEYGEMAEPPEQEALAYLAAMSVLARWIDKAQLVGK